MEIIEPTVLIELFLFLNKENNKKSIHTQLATSNSFEEALSKLVTILHGCKHMNLSLNNKFILHDNE